MEQDSTGHVDGRGGTGPMQPLAALCAIAALSARLFRGSASPPLIHSWRPGGRASGDAWCTAAVRSVTMQVPPGLARTSTRTSSVD